MELTPPDMAVAGWLHTLGITSCCEWDVLIFLSRHQTTLLDAEALTRLLGYRMEAVVAALDVLESLALVERSRISQGARLYMFTVPFVPPRREAFAQLQALGGLRAGRVRIVTQLRRGQGPLRGEASGRPGLAYTRLGGRPGGPAQAYASTERKKTWRKVS